MNFKEINNSDAYENWIKESINLKVSIPYRKGKTKKKWLFFRTPEWRRLREKVIKFYGRKCMKCKTESGPMHVDHIRPRYYHPELSLSFDNMQVLCKKCNKEKGINTVDYRPKKVLDYTPTSW